MEFRCPNCGRNPFISSSCVICAKTKSLFQNKSKISGKDFQGTSPAPFVSSIGYPHINVGLLSTSEQTNDAFKYDAPSYWSKEKYSIPQIINYRNGLINSRHQVHIKESSRFLDIAQEIALSSIPLDIEVNLKNKPVFKLNTDPHAAPHGTNAKLKKAVITSNSKIHTKVDKVFSDGDWKAADAINYLYSNNFDENMLTRMLSVGTLGIKKQRKIVPTRWSIVATDDAIGKNLIKIIKEYPLVDCTLLSGSYFGNYYFICLFPREWSFELYETYSPSHKLYKNTHFWTDYEDYNGRKNYASSCVGGYYTVRLAIAEYLKKIKKQASVFTLRITTEEYAAPLGVWVTREAARIATNSSMIFEDKNLLLLYLKKTLFLRFHLDLDPLIKKSMLFTSIHAQRKITDFQKE